MEGFILLIYFFIIVLLVKIYKQENVHKFFSFLLFLKFTLWTFLPVLISVFDWELADNISFRTLPYNVYVTYVLYDALYLLAIHTIFYLLISKFNTSKLTFFTGNFQVSSFLLRLIILFSIIIIILVIIVSNYDYIELNDVDVDKPFINLIAFAEGYAVAAILSIILFFRQNISKKLFFLLHVLYLIYSVKLTLLGSRIAIVGPLILYMYYYFFQTGLGKKLFLTIPVVLFSVGVISIMPVLSSLRNDKISFSDVLNNTNSIDTEIILRELITKTNGVYYGAVLCEKDGISKAGINPYVNSLVAIIPGFILKNKPVPTSIDGTIMGIPSRVAGSYIVLNSTIFNVGLADSSVALWHGGLIGLIFNVLFASLIMIFISNNLQSGKIYSILVSFMFIKFPVLVINGTFDGFLRDFPRFLLVYILLFVFMHFLRFYNVISTEKK